MTCLAIDEDMMLSTCSWSCEANPMVLGQIFEKNKSVAVWQRPVVDEITNYFDAVFKTLGMGIRGVFSIASLQGDMASSLPNGIGKQAVIDDIYLLSDMLTTLFDCEHVGVRLVPLNSAMCPRFHVDNIPVRLVSTYLGSGTQWLPQESASELLPKNTSASPRQSRLGQAHNDNSNQEKHIRQMNTFDVGLLKGKAWQGHEDFAAVHRSCAVNQGDKRVLLTLDPM